MNRRLSWITNGERIETFGKANVGEVMITGSALDVVVDSD